MELIYMPDCDKTELPQGHRIIANSFFQEMVAKLELYSLDKLIITGAEDVEYFSALQQYGSELDHNISITNSEGLIGAAVVIHGIIDGGIKQRIFIRATIYAAFFTGYAVKAQGTIPQELAGTDWDIGLRCITHELGHALEYQTSYELYHYSAPDKGFNLRYEYEEYIQHEAMQLWSEYFAERLSSSLSDHVDYTPLDSLEDYLRDNVYPHELRGQLNHSYRVTYFLVHHLASCHGHEQQFTQANLDKCSHLPKYQKVFLKISDVLQDLFLRQGKWHFEEDLQSLTNAYNGIIECEREIYG